MLADLINLILINNNCEYWISTVQFSRKKNTHIWFDIKCFLIVLYSINTIVAIRKPVFDYM